GWKGAGKPRSTPLAGSRSTAVGPRVSGAPCVTPWTCGGAVLEQRGLRVPGANTQCRVCAGQRRVWDSNPRGRVNALAVFKGAEHCILASLRIHSRLVSAGQRRDGVSPYPCGSLRIPARLFSKCSTSRSRVSAIRSPQDLPHKAPPSSPSCATALVALGGRAAWQGGLWNDNAAA